MPKGINNQSPKLETTSGHLTAYQPSSASFFNDAALVGVQAGSRDSAPPMIRDAGDTRGGNSVSCKVLVPLQQIPTETAAGKLLWADKQILAMGQAH